MSDEDFMVGKECSLQIATQGKITPSESATGGARREIAAAFGEIFVPINSSTEFTQALKFAANLAGREGGRITLLHVVGPIYDLRDYGCGPVRRRRANEGLLRHAKRPRWK